MSAARALARAPSAAPASVGPRRGKLLPYALCALAALSVISTLVAADSLANWPIASGSMDYGRAALAGSALISVLLAIVCLAQRAGRHSTEAALRGTIAKQSERLEEILATSKLIELLQVCHSLSEANRVIRGALPRLLRAAAGAFYVSRGPESALELQVSWGDLTPAQSFSSEDCWALRRSRPHSYEPERSSVACQHFGSVTRACLCAPLVADGLAFAVLHVQSASAEPVSADVQRVVAALADQLSLVVGNLRLQETLRSGSERDPLTDLYNRRHLEISLHRELARAQRHGHPVSLVMLDVDHFKEFNDTHGHDAGDAVLCEVAQVLKRHSRAEDIACRYGGEEFLLVLPSCSLDDAYAKAEAIREAIAQRRVVMHGSALPRITASLGIASYPLHGERMEELISCADAALYQAKASGRNRIIASSPPGDVVLFEQKGRGTG